MLITAENKPASKSQFLFVLVALALFGVIVGVWIGYTRAAAKNAPRENSAAMETLSEKQIDDVVWDAQFQAVRDRHNEYINRLIEGREKAKAGGHQESYDSMINAIADEIERRDSEITEMRKARRAAELQKQPVSQEYLDKLKAGQKAYEARKNKN